jgi:hypothetical protein
MARQERDFAGDDTQAGPSAAARFDRALGGSAGLGS